MDTVLAIVVSLLVVLFWFSGVVYGWRLHQKHLHNRMLHLLDAVEEHSKEDIIHITIEKHDGVIRVYDKETKQFMAQGQTGTEVELVLSKMYPGKKFAAADSEIKQSGLRDA